MSHPETTVIALDAEHYRELRMQLVFRPKLWINISVLALDAGLMYLFALLVSGNSWLAYGAAQLILVVVFFHHFSILHDCGHGSCAEKRWLNTLIGHYASIFCFMPFFPWQYIHNQHHCWVGNVEKDPTLKLVHTYDASAKVKNTILRWAWRLWIPVLALAQHFVLWSYPLVMWREGRLHCRMLLRCLFSIILPLAAYCGLVLLFPETITIKNIVPAAVIYLLAVELVNFPHHIGTEYLDPEKEEKLAPWDQHRVTRTCDYPLALAELLVLNFSFHTEHHLFPTLPWYRLRKARDLIRPQLGAAYHQSEHLTWSIENRQRDAADVFTYQRSKEERCGMDSIH